MKNLILSMGLTAALSTTALAADLPSRRQPPVYIPPPVPVFTWTGGYVGGTAGYAFDNHNDVAFDAASGLAAAAGNLASQSNGFTGGGTIGYNVSTQSLPFLGGSSDGGLGGGGLVFGIEADAAYTDLHRDEAFGGLGGAFSTRTNFVGTVRGRLGIAFDRLLVYGTGGFAYGGVRNNASFGDFPYYSGSHERLQDGYSYGGGVEFALPTTSFVNIFNSSAVTIKAEYLRYDLGRETFQITANNGFAFAARNHVDGNLARAGLNFKFGTPVAAPVVARY